MPAAAGHYDWEPISLEAGYIYTERMRVPGGWLYRNLVIPEHENEAPAVALTFVPEALNFPASNAGVEPH